MNTETHPVFEQISLFDDAYTLYNSGIANLISLNLQAASDSFERYGKLNRAGKQVENHLRIINFLNEKLARIPDNEEEPAYLYDLLNVIVTDTENCVGLSKDIRDGIFSSIQRKIIQAIEEHHLDKTPYLSNSVPVGFVYLQAGRPDEAILALQACLPVSPDNALIYGYLGDAYIMRNEIPTARQCYLNACMSNPKALDWNFLKDSDLVFLKNKLVDRYGNESIALDWLPVHAMLQDIFKPKLLGLYEGLKELVDDYVALQKKFQRNAETGLKAKLFIRAILLCNQEAYLKFIKTVNFIDIRKQMKILDAGLFAKYLKWIEKRSSNSK
ncbi:MAG: Tetratricopeptide repeat protein [Syntrophus sp. PtaB.Bin001]|nr:MAG: Tetratricopeptide repeat protein [Syntrophus sp. PtaB.Bin001]